MEINLALIYFSALSFIVYGINSLFSKRMALEYERWGFKKQRIVLSSCQTLGGLGLLVGLAVHPLLITASFLLLCMMLVAVVVRLKVRDGFVKTLPALLYVMLNLSIFYDSIT